MLFLRFLGALPKQTTVVLHQFPDQQEGVNGCDAVGDLPSRLTKVWFHKVLNLALSCCISDASSSLRSLISSSV